MAGMEESSFLMHRVELKDLATTTRTNVKVNVPNAPCGVEREIIKSTNKETTRVPNAPCGVERR